MYLSNEGPMSSCFTRAATALTKERSMFRTIQLVTACLGMVLAGAVWAQAPADAPAGTTGQCKDGSYTSQATKKGACHGHKGVQAWYVAATSDAAKSTAPAKTTTGASPATAAPAPTAQAPAVKSTNAMAPGGGPGQVWVNTASK